jgi:hypothetical protein
MTSTTFGSGTDAVRRASSTRRAMVWILVVVGFVVVGVIAGAPEGDDGAAFDPSSSGPGGTKAMVLLLESFGARVDVASELPGESTDVAVVFSDRFGTADVRQIENWVDRGGTLVVTDPFGQLTPSPEGTTGTFGVAPALEPDRCDIAALGDIAAVDPGVAALYDVGPEARSCFGDGRTAFVVEEDVGQGSVISVGGGEVFVNQRLGDADNAVLVTRLLVPAPGTRVTLLQPDDSEGGGERSLSDVISTGARLAIFQLLVAFLVYAWFRARRLGKPVLEPQPVEIAGSELVIAVGQLLQQTKDPGRAATLLRADVRRVMAERLGLPPGTRPDVLADVVVARTGVDEERVRRLLTDTPIVTDAELVDLAQAIDALRKEVLDD